MQAKERWLAWVLDESSNLELAMPWERGQRGPSARAIVGPAKAEEPIARSA